MTKYLFMILKIIIISKQLMEFIYKISLYKKKQNKYPRAVCVTLNDKEAKNFHLSHVSHF